MLKIYDKKEDVPEAEKEFFEKHYKQRSDGKYEPQIEGINSIGGILNKNSELLTKVAEIPKLQAQIRDFENKEILTDGKIAVDKTEFDAMKTENDSYKTLGSLDEIKPKIEGFDDLHAKVKREIKDKALLASGVTDLDRAKRFKSYDALEIESETKDGKEIFYSVTKDDKGKESKTEFNAETLKSDAFKDDLGALAGTPSVQFPRQKPIGDGQSPNPVDVNLSKYSPPASAAVKTV